MSRYEYIRRTAVALVAVVAFAAAPLAGARTLPLPPAESVEAITPTELRMHLEFLASKEVGGRYTLSPGLQIAGRYLASRLEAYGYKGAGKDGSFFQPFDVVSTKVDLAKTRLSIVAGGKSQEYEYGDFVTTGEAGGAAEGKVVFVGYGVSSKAQNHDDYAGLDVKGKIVLYAPGVPKGVDESKLDESESGRAAAAKHGAVGAVMLVPARYLGFIKSPSFKDYVRARENVQLAGSGPAFPSASLLPDVADRLLEQVGTTANKIYEASKSGDPLAPKAVEATVKLDLQVTATRQTAENVVGVLEGNDPKLKDEYVAISAHFDHLKTNAKGEIYPGADDDGSGTSAVLALARAFSIQRPARSIFVIFHAGEELGLLGSEYNTDVAPAIPLDRIVTDLNIDMIGRSRKADDSNPKDKELTDENSVYVIGSDKLSKELHQISEQTNADTEKLRFDYTYNDENHPSRIYYRSDHWNYAKHGIPIIFYFSGEHADYHQPTDTVDKIDFTKMARVARVVFATAWRIANLDHRLQKD